jgi:hypothetical protein
VEGEEGEGVEAERVRESFAFRGWFGNVELKLLSAKAVSADKVLPSTPVGLHATINDPLRLQCMCQY